MNVLGKKDLDQTLTSRAKLKFGNWVLMWLAFHFAEAIPFLYEYKCLSDKSTLKLRVADLSLENLIQDIFDSSNNR